MVVCVVAWWLTRNHEFLQNNTKSPGRSLHAAKPYVILFETRKCETLRILETEALSRSAINEREVIRILGVISRKIPPMLKLDQR